MAAAQAQHAGVHGLDNWLETLQLRIDAEPEPATLEEALAPLARLRDEHGQPIDVAAAQRAAALMLNGGSGVIQTAL